jgi:RecA-family ATPase
MIEPEFPEDHGAYDAAGNYLGESETWPRKSTVVDFAAPKLSTTENAAMDIKAIQKDRETGSCYQYKTFDELSAEPVEKRWLIKGIFARGETSAWIAPPGAMKSALMAEASICVAAGHNWHGYRNKGEAGVVYFALERSDLVNRRLRAHALRQNLKGLPIFVSSAVIDLTNPEAFKKVIDTVRSIQARHNVSVGLIIVDTFAKLIAAARGDENSARDQGQVFANVQRVKNSIDAHVALIGQKKQRSAKAGEQA